MGIAQVTAKQWLLVPLVTLVVATARPMATDERTPTPGVAALRRIGAAREVYDHYAKMFAEERGYLTPVYQWSVRWRDAEMFLARQNNTAALAIRAHLARMRACRNKLIEWTANGAYNVDDYLATENYQAEALVQHTKMETGALGDYEMCHSWLLEVATARLIYNSWESVPRYPELFGGRLKNTDQGFVWSRRVLNASLQAESRTDRKSAVQAYLERTRRLESLIKEAVARNKADSGAVDEATYYRADAELLFLGAGHEDGNKKDLDETQRWRKERVSAAKAFYEYLKTHARTLDQICVWSSKWRDAELESAPPDGGPLRAARAHLSRMEELRKRVVMAYETKRTDQLDLWIMDYFCSDAEVVLQSLTPG
jgi:hypothetical protein